MEVLDQSEWNFFPTLYDQSTQRGTSHPASGSVG